MSKIFISHASKDDDFVKELRIALEAQGLETWVDSRELPGGSKLSPEIKRAIEEARHFIAVISLNTINSAWVRNEIQQALEVEKTRKTAGYRVIPLMLPGIEPSALGLWFGDEPVGVKIESGAGALSEALPAILAALGERLQEDRTPPPAPTSRPVEELQLKLSDPKIEIIGDKRTVSATAELVYIPADPGSRKVESKRFLFAAPIGPIETDELRWYLEKFYLWPTGVFKDRACRIEARLPEWGKALYNEAIKSASTRDALDAWKKSANGAERRFSILMDSDLPDGADEDAQANANEAASELLALPWELLHDMEGYLFQGASAVRVRRQLPNRNPQPVAATKTPIRILLASPRPEQENLPYIDHRISARPMVEAVEQLGELAELRILSPPTFQALQTELKAARRAGSPYDVIHFDGHGDFDPDTKQGRLYFEDPKGTNAIGKRAAAFVEADRIAEIIRDHRVPLVFLEACRSAQGARAQGSIAETLLRRGVASVVAMTHTVLVETSRRFVAEFYGKLAHGERVGTAMLAGQQALHADDYRGRVLGAGDLRLQDWFIPVLFQEEQDMRLITRLPSNQARELESKKRRLSLGGLLDPPAHGFIGRSRELLLLERLLTNINSPELNYVVILGQGGEGKTTLAVESAHWLVRTRRFRRAAYICLEQTTSASALLDHLGQQLLGGDWSYARSQNPRDALRTVERALREKSTIIVIDDCESILSSAFSSTRSQEGAQGSEEGSNDGPVVASLRASSRGFVEENEIFSLCRQLLRADASTRIVFASRESLPAPFNHKLRETRLEQLSPDDAIEIVSQIMKQERHDLLHDDAGANLEEITDLVDAVGRHARALTLLTREIARQGVRVTTENLRRIMADLHRRFPNDSSQSLFASVELSLRRLSPQVRERLAPLGVCHTGAHLYVISKLLDVDRETAQNLGKSLIEVGLAEAMPYNHLRLDPALPHFLLLRMEPSDQEATCARWAEHMTELLDIIGDQLAKDARIAAALTLMELPNLMALLAWITPRESPDFVVETASKLEKLLSHLGRPKALALATATRLQAARGFAEDGPWSQARYLNGAANIDRFLQRGQAPAGLTAARWLLARCRYAGPGAYPDAMCDTTMAQFSLGRALRMKGDATAALAELNEVRGKLEDLAATQTKAAELTIPVVLTEAGDCLRSLGRLNEASAKYEEAIKRAETSENHRQRAVAQFQLGAVRMLQQRYDETLAAYEAALKIFESLGEPLSIASAWHQIGMVYRRTGQYALSEQAHRQSLTIRTQQQDLAGETLSLSELGNLLNSEGRLEEAAKVYRQAADRHRQAEDQRQEGFCRNNLADALIKLKRYDEARAELLQAVVCKAPFGHVAQPWTTWELLLHLEQVCGDSSAARAARERAIESFLAYRRDGGENHERGGPLCSRVYQAILQRSTAEMAQRLDEWSKAEHPADARALIPKLQAILRGDRDLSLADDQALDYRDAAELRLILEALNA